MQTKSNYSRRNTESKQPSLFAIFLFCFLLAFFCILCFLFLGFVSFDLVFVLILILIWIRFDDL